MPSRSAGERLTATCRIRGRKPLFFVVAKRLLICGQAQPHPSGLIFQISDALEKRFPSANLRHDENPLFSAIFEHPEGGSMLSGSGASTNRRWAPADPEDRVAADRATNPSAQVVYRDYALADQAFFSSRMAKAAA